MQTKGVGIDPVADVAPPPAVEPDRLVLLGENHLRHVVDEYLVHYHEERNHQGCGGQIIEPGNEVGLVEGTICRRERLGGMFNYYYRDAA
jgi:hypothetical protein